MKPDFGELDVWINNLHSKSKDASILKKKTHVSDVNEFSFPLLMSLNIPSVEQNKFYLNSRLAEAIKDEIKQENMIDPDFKVRLHYVRYMALTARQILNSICHRNRIENDPYIFSTYIDTQLWHEPKNLENDLKFLP